MPELPEVETMRRGIAPVVGAVVSDVHRVVNHLRPINIAPGLRAFRRRVVGKAVRSTDRRGKRLVVHLEAGQSIVFEPRMTGLVLLGDPPSHEHLRFRIDLRGTGVPHLWFWDRRGLGSVRLLTDRQLKDQLGPTRLGPDALAIEAAQLRERLGRRRAPIKVALLDQRAVAGVGNLYASEILHVARIHPGIRCDRLTRTQWQRLTDAMAEVLREAIRYEGSTLSDGTYRTVLNNLGSYQNHHRVYDRRDELCGSCQQSLIRRIVQAQRSTFYCPRCQSRRTRGRSASAAAE